MKPNLYARNKVPYITFNACCDSKENTTQRVLPKSKICYSLELERCQIIR